MREECDTKLLFIFIALNFLVKQEFTRNPNLMAFGLWLFTVLCIAIAMIFGLVSSIFAIINTVMTPIEVITGIQGLFLWNGLGGKS